MVILIIEYTNNYNDNDEKCFLAAYILHIVKTSMLNLIGRDFTSESRLTGKNEMKRNTGKRSKNL